MRFADTQALYLLFASLLAIGLYWRGIKRKKAALASFGDPGLILRGREQVSYGRQAGKAALVVIASIFITLSAARFQCGTHLESVKREGIDLIIAVDVSRSMLAEDMRPNRLARAVQEVRDIIDSLRGDRIGLVAFAGDAFVQCPLTLDYSAAAIFLEAFDADLIAQQGTAIGEAIRVASGAFESSEKKHKALILLTDGEDHDTGPIEAAQEAAELGVRIYPIGIGSVRGEPIPAYDERGNRVGFVKDENEQVVVSRLDESTLREIARKTNGAYFRATPGGVELERVMAEVRQIETKELKGTLATQYEDRYQWPLLLGLLLLMTEFILPERPGSLWRRLSGADITKREREIEEL